MDSTQIYFSMQVADVPSCDGMTISMPAPEIDLGASVFLTGNSIADSTEGLFFSLQSSLESAVFHVREGFDKFTVSVKSCIGKVFGKVRSMWRERAVLKYFPKVIRHSAVLVMRT